jgi:hypothetical protein
MELPIFRSNVNLICLRCQEGFRRGRCQPQREILSLAAQEFSAALAWTKRKRDEEDNVEV